MAVNKALLAVGPYIFWGLFLPLSISGLQNFEDNAFALMVKRVFWCMVIFSFIQFFRWRKQEILNCLQIKHLLLLFVGGVLLFINWFVFIYAVQSDQLSEAALGYFILPFFKVGFGVVLFKERLDKLQLFAIMVSVIGVSIVIYATSSLPLIAFAVALSFSFYALIRKYIQVDNLTAMWFELWIMCIILLIWRIFTGDSANFALFNIGVVGQLWAVALGIFTILPLFLYNTALRVVGLSMMGVISWLGPSFHFLLSIFYYKEQVQGLHLLSFIFIWLALFLYAISLYRHKRTKSKITVI